MFPFLKGCFLCFIISFSIPYFKVFRGTAHLDKGFYNRYNGCKIKARKRRGGTVLQYREYDTEILNRIKDVEKQILCKYIEICEKYHLRYFVAFGTLLGTVRHKGFIPMGR